MPHARSSSHPTYAQSSPGFGPNVARDSPLFTRDFILVLAMQSLFGISFSSFLILPKFLKLELHATAEQIGWMAAAALGSAAFFSPFVGAATTRLDRRVILLIAIIAEVSAALGFMAVDHVGTLALALRCTQGLAFVAVFTGNSSLVADTIPNHQLSRALGYLGASMLVTNAVAPLLAEPVATHLGWRYVFGGAAAMSACSLVIITNLRPSRAGDGPDNVGTTPTTSAVSTLAVQYGSLLMGAGLGVMFTYVQPFALERGASVVGQLFLGYAAAATLVRVLLGGVSDRLGPALVAAASLCLYGAVVLTTSQLTPSMLLYLGVGLGVSHGFLYPALTAAGLCVVARAERGKFLGWFAFCFNLGFALTVVLLGPMADRYGYPAIFLSTGILLLTGGPVLYRFGHVN